MIKVRAIADLIKKWTYRFTRFSIIGTAVWVVNTVLYFSLFKFFGELTWFVTLFTGVMEFALITYFNKKGKGNMFDRPKENTCNSSDNAKSPIVSFSPPRKHETKSCYIAMV